MRELALFAGAGGGLLGSSSMEITRVTDNPSVTREKQTDPHAAQSILDGKPIR